MSVLKNFFSSALIFHTNFYNGTQDHIQYPILLMWLQTGTSVTWLDLDVDSVLQTQFGQD